MDEEEDDPKRLPYLVSALVHLTLILVVVTLRLNMPAPPPAAEEQPRIVERVRLVAPPPEVAPRPALPRPQPTPPPTPPPAGKDRISIGAPSDRRQERLLLERDVELTNETIGPGRAGPTDKKPGAEQERPGRPGPQVLPSPVVADGGTPSGLQFPTGPRAQVPQPVPGPSQPSLRNTLRDLDRRIGSGDQGLVKGGGQRMGPLLFDPRGADFTSWYNHFRREIYRNWNIPQPALLGLKGHLDVEFTVLRDGTVTNVTVLKGSGVSAFDKAAVNALVASSLQRLPADFRPDSVTMQASFFYNEDPQHS